MSWSNNSQHPLETEHIKSLVEPLINFASQASTTDIEPSADKTTRKRRQKAPEQSTTKKTCQKKQKLPNDLTVDNFV